MKNTLKVGQTIQTTHRLERKSIGKGWRNRIWESCPIKEITVYIIGIRTLANGYVEGESDEGFYFDVQETIKAYLVVENLYRKPFYILRNE